MRWFKHDSDANLDAKLCKVATRYGLEGYGLYWYCLELIARNVDKHNLTFELEHDAELISARWGMHQDQVQEMMAYMVDLRLFECSNGIITCMKMATRTDEYTQKVISKSGNVPTVSGQNPRKSALLEENRTEQNKKEKDITTSPAVNDDVPFTKILNIYHQTLCPPLPRVEKLTQARKGYIRQRYREDLTELDHWQNFFNYVKQSPFLMGQTEPLNGRRVFRADLEWLVKPSNFAKIAEEKYHG